MSHCVVIHCCFALAMLSCSTSPGEKRFSALNGNPQIKRKLPAGAFFQTGLICSYSWWDEVRGEIYLKVGGCARVGVGALECVTMCTYFHISACIQCMWLMYFSMQFMWISENHRTANQTELRSSRRVETK